MENKENKEIFIPDEIIDTPDGIIDIPSESILLSKMGTSRATSGTIVNNFRTGYKVQAVWTVNSQNVANNTSNVTVKVQLCSTGSSYTISSSATKNGSVTINGTTYSFTFTAGLSGNQTKTVYTKTVDIPHNSDGTKSFSISATLGIAVTLSGTYWGNVTANGTASLNSIPRTSSFTLNTTSGTIGSTQFTVTINRASTAFTHKVYYKFGSINWLGTSSATTSFSFTPALSDCSQIPNATSGTGSIVVETYNGSTFIGSTSKSITLSVPTSVKPTISSLTATVVANGADTSYGYVKGKSKCKLVINGATGSQGSTIKSYSISGGGFSDSNSTFTTGALNTAGNITFTATVTDSRGRKSDAKTVTINVLDYTNPNITGFNVIRCDSSGNANEDGTYLKIWATYTYSTLGGKNSLTTRAEFKKTSSSTWVNAGAISNNSSIVTGSNGIATDSSYDVRFTITDNFSPISKSMVIPTAFVTLDFKKGGKGIAIGKASESDNLLDIAMNTKITKDLQLSGKLQVSKGNVNPETGRTSERGQLYTYNTVSGNTGSPTTYSSVIGFGRGTGGTVEICGEWTGGQGLWVRALRDTIDDWFPWQRVYTTAYKPTWNDIQSKPTIISDGATLGRLTFSNWIYSTGNTGWYNSTYGGGWYMTDSTWMRAYNNKAIYCDGTARITTAEHRYIRGNQNGSYVNLDLVSYDGKCIAFNPSAGSGANILIDRAWSGSSGTEPSFRNNKGNGWGFIGNSGTSFYRVYGAGGSVSDRNKKYEILKADTETQYENIKNLNIYNYRTISTQDTPVEELVENFFNANFISVSGDYITTTKTIDGKEYRELDENLSQEEVKELRIKEIIEKNPNFGECKREDLSLGCMIDEMPLETTFYDNEGGDGKAVDMYSYTTMVLGATKHLITKVETLEKENEELRNRLDKMEEMLNGIINKG